MRQDLVKLIETHEEVTNAIVLTHNIDFVFLQSIVLPALRHCGRPKLTVFADVQCAAETFASQSPVLSSLGIRYRVVPVAMSHGFRFHPKALLLSGPEKATLWVGSGNLTFGGWRENAEVWIRFESDKDTTGPFAAFRGYLQDILTRIPLSERVQDEVAEAFDGRTRQWAQNMVSPSGLLGRMGRGPSLLAQIQGVAGAGSVERLVVCSPYYDAKAEALGGMVESLKPQKTEVLVQAKHPGLPRVASKQFSEDLKMVPVGFTRKGENDIERESFIHAKFYGLSNKGRTIVIAGSANCSNAALTIAGAAGNGELMAIQSLSTNEFKEQYLNEIPQTTGTVELPDTELDVNKDAPPITIRIMAARYERGLLRIAYDCSAGVSVTSCLIHDGVLPITPKGEGVAVIEIAQPPARISLEGTCDGKVVRSHESWVDVEHELGATARGRSFASAVRDGVRSDRWNVRAWKDVMDVFCKHLHYMPLRASGWGHAGRSGRTKELAEFTADDVFSIGYGLPNLGSAVKAGFGDDRVRSLQQMLLRYFGTPETDETEMDVGDLPVENDDGDEGVVDRPERLVIRKPSVIQPKTVTDVELKRAKKSVEQMTLALTNEEFLNHRLPELLAADLKIAAILLCTALAEGWIGEDNFFEATRVIWSSLFFSSPGKPSQGWLERRYRESEDPEDFAARMASPELSAAFATWSIKVTAPNKATPAHASYVLAQILAVARLPWLWRGGTPERIGQEIVGMRSNTEGTLSEIECKHIENVWVQLIRRGEALKALEYALAGHSPAEICERIHQDQMMRGELLWQGDSGYCVLLAASRRSQIKNVPVLRLQGQQVESNFKPKFLIPLRGLLDPEVLQITEKFGRSHRDVLSEMIVDFARPFSRE